MSEHAARCSEQGCPNVVVSPVKIPAGAVVLCHVHSTPAPVEPKRASQLAEAAKRLEQGLPTTPEIVLGEVRSAGYAVRTGYPDENCHRFYDKSKSGSLVGMMIVRQGVITYAEWNFAEDGRTRVFPLWPSDDDVAHEQSLRALIDAIRDDRIEP